VENAGASTAGVDECRRPALSRYFACVDTQGGPAPVDMRVEVDQPGHDNQPMASPTGRSCPISVTLPSAKAMPTVSSRLVSGSITRLPVRTRPRICAPRVKRGSTKTRYPRSRKAARATRLRIVVFAPLATSRSRKTAKRARAANAASAVTPCRGCG